MKSIVVIPARYHSARLPGKPMIEINGKPMIQRVWEQAKKILDVQDVIVATDHDSIYRCIRDLGGDARFTSTSHVSGSDRVAEVAKDYPQNTIVLNLQGDLPYVSPRVCRCLIEHLQRFTGVDITTPVIGVESLNGLNNPSIVKAIFDLNFRALYFSRQSIPGRETEFRAFGPQWYRHIGLYAYRNSVLQELAVSAPTVLEQQEQLEQLRALELGYHIRVVPVVEDCGPDINCPEDLKGLENQNG